MYINIHNNYIYTYIYTCIINMTYIYIMYYIKLYTYPCPEPFSPENLPAISMPGLLTNFLSPFATRCVPAHLCLIGSWSWEIQPLSNRHGIFFREKMGQCFEWPVDGQDSRYRFGTPINGTRVLVGANQQKDECACNSRWPSWNIYPWLDLSDLES